MVSGIALGLSQPDWGAWPLAFFGLTGFVWAIEGRPRGQRIWLGWCVGTAATLTTPWLPGARGFATYFDLPLAWSGLIALSIAQLFGAGSTMLAAALAGSGGRPDASGPIRFSLGWTAAEWLRTVSFSGLPWMLLAHALAAHPVATQGAAVAGVLGVSFTLALSNAAIVQVWRHPRRLGGWACGAVAAGAIFVPSVWPAPSTPDGRVFPVPRPGAPVAPDAVRFALVQGDRRASRTTRPSDVTDGVARLSRLASAQGPVDVVVWPENAVAAPWPANQALVRAPNVTRTSPWLVFGTPRFDERGLHNSAILLDADGNTTAAHDKVRLLPFAEQMPWPLPPGPHDLGPGLSPRNLPTGAVRLGPLICYEVLFEGIARTQADRGASVLLNLSNEAWFFSRPAMEQNLAAATYRALESGRPMLRATNTGITAAIDAHGRVVARLAPDRAGALAVDVVPAHGTTPYRRFGFAFGPVATALAVGPALWFGWRRRSETDPPPSSNGSTGSLDSVSTGLGGLHNAPRRRRVRRLFERAPDGRLLVSRVWTSLFDVVPR